MKLTTIGIAGISTLIGLAFMSAVIAAEPTDDRRRPAFEGGRGPGPGSMGGRFGNRRGPDAERQIERLDANDDGQVSDEEFVDSRLARLDDMFARQDRNDDGLISLDEDQRPERAGRPDRSGRADRPNHPERPDIEREDVVACVRETIADFAPNADMDIEDRFENVDTDGNGSVTLAELSTALETRAHEAFARIDGDDNGFITEEELQAQREEQLETGRVVRDCVRELAEA